MVQRGKNLIRAGTESGDHSYFIVDDCKAIRPMFENTWSANLVTLSVILEETSDDQIAMLCIEGFVHSIKICGYYDLRTERDAFVSSFAKFTLVSNQRKIQPKNIMCI